jgi:hypothetical protein
MADITITALTTASGIDGAVDWIAIDRTSLGTTQKINRQTLLGVTGQPMDISSSQNVTNKTLDNTNTITLKDTLFTLQDDGDTTKQARFQLSGITTATTRTYTLPNASSTLADIATAQTFTNKTLTSPVITGGSITGTTITSDAIVGQSASTSGTVYGVSISSGTIGSAGLASSSVTTAKIAASAVDYTKVAAGFVVQVVGTNFSAVATGTTLIPSDDTIPQITEGTEFMTQAITPKSATNILVIDATLFISNSLTTPTLTAALFQDATANALAASSNLAAPIATGTVSIRVRHVMTAGTTLATTFRIREGADGASTNTFNGQGGVRRYGGITLSSITITEYKA